MMKLLKSVFILIGSFLFLLLVNQYLLCPQFSFVCSSKFDGDQWYNPYEGMQNKWDKYNFHAHTKAWFGLTNGKGNESDVAKKYSELGYKKCYVSNYHLPSKKSSLPVYEHGINIQKTHQQIIGNYKVLWLDYFFPQTLSNKQYILNRISTSQNILTVLNHPLLRGGYTEKEMEYLNNFQLMEVLHPFIDSKSVWDAALSRGKPVFNICNDDLHNIYAANESGRYCTMLSNKIQDETAIANELKLGRNYGIKISYNEYESESERVKRIKYNLPELKEIKLNGHELSIVLSQKAEKIIFVSDNGKVRKIVSEAISGKYVLNKSDSYVRIEAFFPDGTEILFNPIYKFKEDPLEGRICNSKISLLKSILFSVIGYLLILIWLILIFKISHVPYKSFVQLKAKKLPNYSKGLLANRS